MEQKEDDNNLPFVSSKRTVRIDSSTLLRYEEDVQALTRILSFSSEAQSEITRDLMILRMLMVEARKPPAKIQEAMSNIIAAKAAALDMLSFVTRRSSLNVVPPDKWKDVVGEVQTVSTRALHALKVGLVEEAKTALLRLLSRSATKEDWISFCEVVALLSELPWSEN